MCDGLTALGIGFCYIVHSGRSERFRADFVAVSLTDLFGEKGLCGRNDGEV